ncbi:hypothetical protein GDO78_011637 [Eleutherodactylus coqui]|uniref:Uncharacterized protein n=1 Tax=Eleutherodactylus coqui TaxID=57060 RepID=A0A8J6F1F0_ELECQ|nr:hypothetical protein GDO78_011637 [Eleutherodactylus coqui]
MEFRPYSYDQVLHIIYNLCNSVWGKRFFQEALKQIQCRKKSSVFGIRWSTRKISVYQNISIGCKHGAIDKPYHCIHDLCSTEPKDSCRHEKCHH